MPTKPMLLLILIGLILVIAFTYYCRLVVDASTLCVRRVTPRGIVNLLGYPSEPSSASVRELLKSRSLANRRLLRTFRLTNTFVLADVHVHNAFVSRMKDLLRAQSRRGQWVGFLNVARQAIVSELNSFNAAEGQGRSSPFSDFIQIVTLRIIVVGLLDPDRDSEGLDAEDLRVSAMLITNLWAMSKSDRASTPSTAASLSHASLNAPNVSELVVTLNVHLRKLLLDVEKYPNPIDFIIPTWETLWRLVATCLAHVYEDEDYRRVFKELLKDPTSGRFNFGSDLCAEWIINETLRLHPPSRHISRSFLVRPHPFLQLVECLFPRFIANHLGINWEQSSIRSEVADIQAVQCSTDIWGADALKFKPRRWAKSSDNTDAPTFFAFGYGPLKCVGHNWAPMAAALIVGVILEGIEEEQLEIVGTRNIGGRGGWDGWRIKDQKASRI